MTILDWPIPDATLPALEHPERFCDGPIDFDWQKAQIAKGA